MRSCGARHFIGRSHRRPEQRQRVAAGERPDEERICMESEADREQGGRQVADRVERADRHAKVVAVRFERRERIGFRDVHRLDQGEQPFAPSWVHAADQERRTETAMHKRQPIEHVLERSLVKEQVGSAPGCPGEPQCARLLVEQIRRHRALVRRRMSGDKTRVGAIDTIKSALNVVLDFALPPRCAGCGSIVGQLHSFCPDCWTEVEFLGDSGCTSCGLPLEATDAELCGVCIAKPPRIQRTRAPVAYGDLSRSIAIKLKYGRKVALARTMARYMAPLISKGGGAPILIPVPLHRTRLWQRGFNQSALVARSLRKRLACGPKSGS